jgi:hypothetical protein
LLDDGQKIQATTHVFNNFSKTKELLTSKVIQRWTKKLEQFKCFSFSQRKTTLGTKSCSGVYYC